MDPPKGSPRLAMEAFPPKLLQVRSPEARQTPNPGPWPWLESDHRTGHRS